jgi:hypothetical protein
MLDTLNEDWKMVTHFVQENFNKKPDTQAILFLIGMRELGIIDEKPFSKKDKVGLMHIAVCKLFSYHGYFELSGLDQDGWPHWEKKKEFPFVNVFEQELLLKQHIVHYFKEEEII